jgi:hypothetical protein
MKALRLLPTFALATMSILAVSAPAQAAPRGGTATCSGSVASPGVLVGSYASNVVVSGACIVPAGPAMVNGNVTVTSGSVLVAAFGQNSSSLTVTGNVIVQIGATAILGCEPFFFTCVDDPNAQNGGTLTSTTAIGGNIIGNGALAVVVHASTVGGNIVENGGGPGVTCVPPADSPSNTPSMELWATLPNPPGPQGQPPYSDYEDTSVHGNAIVTGLGTCWLGLNRLDVGGNMIVNSNQLADPDGIEILSNNVSNNLICQQNSFVWDSSEASLGQLGLYPCTPQPNTVGGHRIGQCVLASPATEGGPPGPGPF